MKKVKNKCTPKKCIQPTKAKCLPNKCECTDNRYIEDFPLRKLILLEGGLYVLDNPDTNTTRLGVDLTLADTIVRIYDDLSKVPDDIQTNQVVAVRYEGSLVFYIFNGIGFEKQYINELTPEDVTIWADDEF